MGDSSVADQSSGPESSGPDAPALKGISLPHTDPAVDFSKVERMLRDDVSAGHLKMEVTDLHLGTATVTMRVTPQMCQGHGTCQGGYMFVLADAAFAAACNSYGPVTVAAAVQINFLAPAHEGDLLVATAREVSRWGRNGLYDVEVRNDKGVVAQFRGTSRTIERS